MTSVRDCLTEDHRHCDDLLALAETAFGQSRPVAVLEAFAGFRAAMLRHFDAEEHTLFPAFEQASGMQGGPTQVMRMEHLQMRQLMDAAVDALNQGDWDEYQGQVDTLLIMMQQHNMKEENILYPMCDNHLAAQTSVLLQQIVQALQGE